MKIFKILIFKQAQEIFKFNTLFYGDKKEIEEYKKVRNKSKNS